MNAKCEARECLFGDGIAGTVNCVDDAWFEGTQSDPPDSFEDILGLTSLGHDLRALETRVQETNKYFSDAGTQPPNWADYRYLARLVELCSKHGLKLRLCNFEYMATNFKELNRPRNALLVDVWNALGGNDPYPDQEFGVHLLADQLNGEHFRCRAFFVTGYPRIVDKLLEDKKRDPKWLPICNHAKALVFKGTDDELHAYLKTFAENFVTYLSWNELEDFGGAIAITFRDEYVPIKKNQPQALFCKLIEDIAGGGNGLDAKALYQALDVKAGEPKPYAAPRYITGEQKKQAETLWHNYKKNTIPQLEKEIHDLESKLEEAQSARIRIKTALQEEVKNTFGPGLDVDPLLDDPDSTPGDLSDTDDQELFNRLAAPYRAQAATLSANAKEANSQLERNKEKLDKAKDDANEVYKEVMSTYDPDAKRYKIPVETSDEDNYMSHLKERFLKDLCKLAPKPESLLAYVKEALQSVGGKWKIHGSEKWRYYNES